MAHRMFAAVLPPQGVVEELDQLLEPRREALPRLRWTKPGGWHITTAFMGSVGDDRVERLIEAFSEVARGQAPFEVNVNGGFALPHPDVARIIVLGVPDGGDELGRLSASTRGAANRIGVRPDGRHFVPHLTLARHSRGFPATRLLGVLDSFPDWQWTAREFVLMESHPPNHRYEVVARFPFGGADALG